MSWLLRLVVRRWVWIIAGAVLYGLARLVGIEL